MFSIDMNLNKKVMDYFFSFWSYHLHIVSNVHLFNRNLHVYNLKFQKCSKVAHRGPPWKVLFFGTDEFSLASLKPLCAKLRTGTLLAKLGVVSKRGSIVTKFAEEENLQFHNWPLEHPVDVSSKYDLGIVVSFGHLIPKTVIETLPLGCVNVHASLLPKWRGAAPITHALMNGDLETGVTVMKVQPHKFDIGEIIRQYRVPIIWNETAKNLENKLADIGAQLLMDCVRDLPRSVRMTTPQPNSGITYAPKINPSMAIINWEVMSAESIYNRHRALCHIYPLSTKWHGILVKFHSLEMDKEFLRPLGGPEKIESVKKSALQFLNSDIQNVHSQSSLPTAINLNRSAGCLKYDKKQRSLKVLCADYRYVSVDNISVGGKVMKAHDFYNGFMNKLGKMDWKFSS